MTQNTSPVASATVSVHALSCGHFNLPEHQFIKLFSSLEACRTVPSLAFLIQHTDSSTGRLTRIMFDLGLRGDLARSPLLIQKHIENRRPICTDPDVTKNLVRGGLTPGDIDYVIYSHVHWDHVGEPRKFPTSTFVVGHGALSLLAGTSPKFRGSPSFFEPDLLPPGRSIELSNPRAHAEKQDSAVAQGTLSFGGPRLAHGILPQILDLFNDGSLLIFNAPGHLPGHINILSRTADGRRVYLGGDSCHDRRLLTGVKEIGEWTDAKGHVCCIHADREEAGETIRRTRMLEQEGVEVIIAHDDEWEDNPANKTRFFGAG